MTFLPFVLWGPCLESAFTAALEFHLDKSQRWFKQRQAGVGVGPESIVCAVKVKGRGMCRPDRATT